MVNLKDDKINVEHWTRLNNSTSSSQFVFTSLAAQSCHLLCLAYFSLAYSFSVKGVEPSLEDVIRRACAIVAEGWVTITKDGVLADANKDMYAGEIPFDNAFVRRWIWMDSEVVTVPVKKKNAFSALLDDVQHCDVLAIARCWRNTERNTHYMVYRFYRDPKTGKQCTACVFNPTRDVDDSKNWTIEEWKYCKIF